MCIGGKLAPSESAPAESTEAAADVEQSQDQIIAELKGLAANRFAYKSVTVDEETNDVSKNDEERLDGESVYLIHWLPVAGCPQGWSVVAVCAGGVRECGR